MSNEDVTIYRVVKPLLPWQLHSRLMGAATKGKKARFTAESVEISPQRRVFTVKVDSAQFNAPAAFDVTDEDGHYIQIKFPKLGPVEFFLYNN